MNTESKYFSLDDGIEMIRKDEKLTKIWSKDAISQEKVQRMGIKIIRTKDRFIYLGLENSSQRSKKSTAAAQSDNMISYRINGGKQLHILK